MLRLTGALALLCLAAAPAAAQDDPPARLDEAPVVVPVDSTAAELAKGNTVILPIVAYTPDTGLALGAFALRFFYLDPPGDGARPSTLSPVFIYTFKNQLIAFLGADLNWGDGRWHARLVPGYQKFPDDFYGIGRDAPADPLEEYTPEQFSFAAMVEREVLGELRLGVGYQVRRHQLLETEAGGRLASGMVRGSGRTVLSAPGLQAAWDTRDNTWAPRRGLWAVATATFYRESWGSDTRFTEYLADLRGYLPVGEGGTLAAQVRYQDVDGDRALLRPAPPGGPGGPAGLSRRPVPGQRRRLGAGRVALRAGVEAFRRRGLRRGGRRGAAAGWPDDGVGADHLRRRHPLDRRSRGKGERAHGFRVRAATTAGSTCPWARPSDDDRCLPRRLDTVYDRDAGAPVRRRHAGADVTTVTAMPRRARRALPWVFAIVGILGVLLLWASSEETEHRTIQPGHRPDRRADPPAAGGLGRRPRSPPSSCSQDEHARRPPRRGQL